MALQGTFSYPGIEAWESFQCCDISGIQPSVLMVRMFPQYGIPDADGDVVLSYDGNTVTFKKCHIDRADYEQGSGGKTVILRLLDERWKWQHYEITGRYNIKLPNNFIDPDHEKTPRELATLCFEAMQVEDFDVSALPNDARPEIDWDHAVPAQELATICDDLGCRIVPQRSTGKWVVVVVGEGADLPDNGWSYNDHGQGIDPKETPDYLKLVTAPFSFQVCLELEHIGKDTDQAWKLLKDLSYKPGLNSIDSYGFGKDVWQQSNLSPIRIRQADGTEISPQELAVQTVMRTMRICDTPGNARNGVNDKNQNTFYLPGYDDMVTRKQIIAVNELVESYTDILGAEQKRSALVFGEWWGDLGEDMGNHNPGTRLDYQESNNIRPEERASFSMAIDPIETDRTIITTSKPMLYYGEYSGNHYYSAAKMFLVCTVQVRDPETWQPIRYEKMLQIGTGNNKEFCRTIIKNDIQPWTIAGYDEYGNLDGSQPIRDNQVEVDRQCDYYLNSIAKTYQTVSSETKTYYGLYPVDLDGAIAQISYRTNKSGADTVVSRGTEHNYDIPTYEQRRQRDGRRNAAEKQKLQKEITDHKIRLMGVNNT